MQGNNYTKSCPENIKSGLMNEVNDVGCMVTNLFNAIYFSNSYQCRFDNEINAEDRAQFYNAFRRLFDLGNDVHKSLKDVQEVYINVLDTLFNVLAKSSGSHDGWWLCVCPLEILQGNYFKYIGICDGWKEKAIELMIRIHKLKTSFVLVNRPLTTLKHNN